MKNKEHICIFILFIFIGYLLCKTYKRITTSKESKSDYDILIFGTMSCPYTVKQIQSFQKSNIPYKFKDTTIENNQTELFQITQNLETSVPVVANPATNKYRIGYSPAKKLISMLN